MDIHIGKLIRDIMRLQGRTPSWLARQLHCDRTNIYKIYNRASIDTDLLQRISKALSYDFFNVYSKGNASCDTSGTK